MTTQKVPDDSVLAKLKTGPGRDPAGALAALEAVAGDADGAKATRDWRARFMACTAPTRAALVGAITLDDQAPRVSEVDSTLREVIGIWKSDEQGREILDELRGWWWSQSKGMLDHADRKRRHTITADELRAQIDYVLSKYTAASLPVSDLLAELTQAEATAYADRVFVEQLRWIGLGPRSLHAHIAEYHHAWAHRSMWLYRNHVCGSELNQFETQLRQEWKLIHAKLADRFDRGRAGPDPETVGEDILDATMEAVREIRLRPNVDKRWIARGTLHALADSARQEEKPLG
ncbi:ABC-three component system protein [Kitasatospora purpeofusca]|uniref:ABC-three component system protein n=1 Tax=Kitasatospora purpeofusca TaxID=67352 RepID=UPI0038689B69